MYTHRYRYIEVFILIHSQNFSYRMITVKLVRPCLVYPLNFMEASWLFVSLSKLLSFIETTVTFQSPAVLCLVSFTLLHLRHKSGHVPFPLTLDWGDGSLDNSPAVESMMTRVLIPRTPKPGRHSGQLSS